MNHPPETRALAFALVWTLVVLCGALLWFVQPAGAAPLSCATPGVYAMPTAASGRPAHERPTYSTRYQMPGGKP